MANPKIQITTTTSSPSVVPAGRVVIGLVGTAPSGATKAVGSLELLSNASQAGYGSTGTIPDALTGIAANANTHVIVVRVQDTPTESQLVAGIVQLETAEGKFGERPDFLLCPGFTWEGGDSPTPAASGVAAQLQTTAEKLDSVAIIAARPGTVAQAKTWAGNNRGKRLFTVFPHIVPVGGTATVDPAPYVAGALSKYPLTVNPLWKNIQGIKSLDPAISFSPHGTTGSDSDLLQSDLITGIVQHNGFHLFGSRMLVEPTSTDDDRFINVLRVVDDVRRHLINASLNAWGRNVTTAFFDDVVNSVQNIIDTLVAGEALRPGSTVVKHPTKNTEAALSAGQAFFAVNLRIVYPVAEINFDVNTGTGD